MTPKPDTKINKIKTVEEIGRSFAKDIGFMPMEQAFNIALTQDRQQLLDAVCGALDEMKVCTPAGKADPSYYHCENTRDGTLEEVKTAIKNLLNVNKK